MKKLLTVIALISFVGTASAGTSLMTKVNNGLNSLEKKEQALNNKIDKAQADRAAKIAEAKKKAEAKKAAAQAKIDAQKKAANDTKQAVDNEISFWKRLFSSK